MLKEVRCKNCNKLHLKAVVFIGAIKCNRCKRVFEYRILDNNNYYINNLVDPKETYDTITKATIESKPDYQAKQ